MGNRVSCWHQEIYLNKLYVIYCWVATPRNHPNCFLILFKQLVLGRKLIPSKITPQHFLNWESDQVLCDKVLTDLLLSADESEKKAFSHWSKYQILIQKGRSSEGIRWLFMGVFLDCSWQKNVPKFKVKITEGVISQTIAVGLWFCGSCSKQVKFIIILRLWESVSQYLN